MNNFSKDNTLNNLLETTKNIFLTLINNPDYQGIGKKSREDVVMQEAMQRAKQHERNRLALALAIQNSHLQRFSDYIFKADEINFETSDSDSYPERTKQNVESADLTIAFVVNEDSPGTRLAAGLSADNFTPFHVININDLNNRRQREEHIANVIRSMNGVGGPSAINVAGNNITHAGMPDQETLDQLVQTFLSDIHNESDNGIESIRSGGQTGADEAGAKAGVVMGIPTTVLSPRNWMFRTSDGDIKDEEAFKNRFEGITRDESLDMYGGDDGIETVGGPERSFSDSTSTYDQERDPLKAIQEIMRHYSEEGSSDVTPAAELAPFLLDFERVIPDIVKRAQITRISTWADKDAWDKTPLDQHDYPIRMKFDQEDFKKGDPQGTTYQNALHSGLYDLKEQFKEFQQTLESIASVQNNEGNWKNVKNTIPMPSNIVASDSMEDTLNLLRANKRDLATNFVQNVGNMYRTLMPTVSRYDPEVGRDENGLWNGRESNFQNRNYHTLLSMEDTGTAEYLQNPRYPKVDPQFYKRYRQADPLGQISSQQDRLIRKYDLKVFGDLLNVLENHYGAYVPVDDPVYNSLVSTINQHMSYSIHQKAPTSMQKAKMKMFEDHLQTMHDNTTKGLSAETINELNALSDEDKQQVLSIFNMTPGGYTGQIRDSKARAKYAQIQKIGLEYKRKNWAVDAANKLSDWERMIGRPQEGDPNYDRWKEYYDTAQQAAYAADLDFDELMGNPDSLNQLVDRHEDDPELNDRVNESGTYYSEDDEETNETNFMYTNSKNAEDYEKAFDDVDFSTGENRSVHYTEPDDIVRELIAHVKRTSVEPDHPKHHSNEAMHNVRNFRDVRSGMATETDAKVLQELADALHKIDGVHEVSLRGSIARRMMNDANHGFVDGTPIEMNIAHAAGADLDAVQEHLDTWQKNYGEQYPAGALDRDILPNFVLNRNNEYGVPLRANTSTQDTNTGKIDERINPNNLRVYLTGDRYYGRFVHDNGQDYGERPKGFKKRNDKDRVGVFPVGDRHVNLALQMKDYNRAYGLGWSQYNDPDTDRSYLDNMKAYIDSLPENTTIITTGLPGAEALGAYLAKLRGLDVREYDMPAQNGDSEAKHVENVGALVKPHIVASFGLQDSSGSKHVGSLINALDNQGHGYVAHTGEERLTPEFTNDLIQGEAGLGLTPVSSDPANSHQIVFHNEDYAKNLPLIGGVHPAGYSREVRLPRAVRKTLETQNVDALIADGSRWVDEHGVVPNVNIQPKNIITRTFEPLGHVTPAQAREMASGFGSQGYKLVTHGKKEKLEKDIAHITNLAHGAFHDKIKYSPESNEFIPTLIPKIFERIDSNIGLKRNEGKAPLIGNFEKKDDENRDALRDAVIKAAKRIQGLPLDMVQKNLKAYQGKDLEGNNVPKATAAEVMQNLAPDFDASYSGLNIPLDHLPNVPRDIQDDLPNGYSGEEAALFLIRSCLQGKHKEEGGEITKFALKGNTDELLEHLDTYIPRQEIDDWNDEVELEGFHDSDWHNDPLVGELVHLLGYDNAMDMLKDVAFNPTEAQFFDENGHREQTLESIITKSQYDNMSPSLQVFATPRTAQKYTFRPPFIVPNQKDLDTQHARMEGTAVRNHILPISFNDKCKLKLSLWDFDGDDHVIGVVRPKLTSLAGVHFGTIDPDEAVWEFAQPFGGRPSTQQFHGIRNVLQATSKDYTLSKLTGIDDLLNAGYISPEEREIRNRMATATPEKRQQYMSVFRQAASSFKEGDDPYAVIDKASNTTGLIAGTPGSRRGYGTSIDKLEIHPREQSRLAKEFTDFDENQYQKMINYASKIVKNKHLHPKDGPYYYDIEYPTEQYPNPQTGEMTYAPLFSPVQAQEILRIVKQELKKPQNFQGMPDHQNYELTYGSSLEGDATKYANELLLGTDITPTTWEDFNNKLTSLFTEEEISQGRKAFLEPYIQMKAMDINNEYIKNNNESLFIGDSVGLNNPTMDIDNHRNHSLYRDAVKTRNAARKTRNTDTARNNIISEFGLHGFKGLPPKIQRALMTTLNESEIIHPLTTKEAMDLNFYGVKEVPPDLFFPLDSEGLWKDMQAIPLQNLNRDMNEFYKKLPAIAEAAEKLGYNNPIEFLEKEGILVPYMDNAINLASDTDGNLMWEETWGDTGYRPLSRKDVNLIGKKLHFWGEMSPEMERESLRRDFSVNDYTALQRLAGDEYAQILKQMTFYYALKDSLEKFRAENQEEYADLRDDPKAYPALLKELGRGDKGELTDEESNIINSILQDRLTDDYIAFAENHPELITQMAEALSLDEQEHLIKGLYNVSRMGAATYGANIEDSDFKELTSSITDMQRYPYVQVIRKDENGLPYIQKYVANFDENGNWRQRHASMGRLEEGQRVHASTGGTAKTIKGKPFKLGDKLNSLNEILESMGRPFEFPTNLMEYDVAREDGGLHEWTRDINAKLAWLEANHGHFTDAKQGKAIQNNINQIRNELAHVSLPMEGGVLTPDHGDGSDRIPIRYTEDRSAQAYNILSNYRAGEVRESGRGYHPDITVEEYLDRAFDLFHHTTTNTNFLIGAKPVELTGEDGNMRTIIPDLDLMATGWKTWQKNADIIEAHRQSLRDLFEAHQIKGQEKGWNAHTIYQAWANDALIYVNQLAKHILPQSLDSSVWDHLRNDFGRGWDASFEINNEIGRGRRPIIREVVKDGKVFQVISDDMQKHPGGVLPIDARLAIRNGINWDRKRVNDKEDFATKGYYQEEDDEYLPSLIRNMHKPVKRQVFIRQLANGTVVKNGEEIGKVTNNGKVLKTNDGKEIKVASNVDMDNLIGGGVVDVEVNDPSDPSQKIWHPMVWDSSNEGDSILTDVESTIENTPEMVLTALGDEDSAHYYSAPDDE